MTTTFKRFATVTGAAALIFGIAGLGQARAANVNYWVANNTKNAIWITVYGNGFEGDKREAFCLTPGQSKVNYVEHNSYANLYIRAEVKDNNNSCGPQSNIFDLGPTMLTMLANGKAQMTYANSKQGARPSVNNTGYH